MLHRRSSIAARECGPCSACCIVHNVAETDSPRGEACRYVKEGGGCSIYEDRPQTCVNYMCHWRAGFGRHRDRPDLLGVVFEAERHPHLCRMGGGFDQNGLIHTVRALRPEARLHSRVQRYIRDLVGDGCVVADLFDEDGEPFLILWGPALPEGQKFKRDDRAVGDVPPEYL